MYVFRSMINKYALSMKGELAFDQLKKLVLRFALENLGNEVSKRIFLSFFMDLFSIFFLESDM